MCAKARPLASNGEQLSTAGMLGWLTDAIVVTGLVLVKSTVSGARMSLYPFGVRDKMLGRVGEAVVAAVLMGCKFHVLFKCSLRASWVDLR